VGKRLVRRLSEAESSKLESSVSVAAAGWTSTSRAWVRVRTLSNPVSPIL
jgi:hypothetical protein